MSDNFAAYHQAMTRAEEAEKRAAENVETLKQRFSPLFSDWKSTYLAGTGNSLPPDLVRGSGMGTRQPVNISDLPTMWQRLHADMVEYDDGVQAAMAAWNSLSAEEQARLEPPPWMRTSMLTEAPELKGTITLNKSGFLPDPRSD